MKKKHSRRAASTLLKYNDFNPWGYGAFDADRAWSNFGGLTLAEAHSKFRDRPDVHQEDFMFMGGKAFAFYFPVIEEYLRELPTEGEEDNDRQEWIIAKGIQLQFESDDPHHVLHLADRVIALSSLIQKNIHRFGNYEADRIRITEAWQELRDLVRSLAESEEPKS